MDQQSQQQQQLLSMNQKVGELRQLMSVNQGLMSTMLANHVSMNKTIESLTSTMNQINLQPQIMNKQQSTTNHYTISTVGTTPSLPPPYQQPQQPPQLLFPPHQPPQLLPPQPQPVVMNQPDQLQQQQSIQSMMLNWLTPQEQQQRVNLSLSQQQLNWLQEQQQRVNLSLSQQQLMGKQQQRMAGTSQNLTQQQMAKPQQQSESTSLNLEQRLARAQLHQQMVKQQQHVASMNPSLTQNLSLGPRQQLDFLNMNQTSKQQQQQSPNDNLGAGMTSSSLNLGAGMTSSSLNLGAGMTSSSLNLGAGMPSSSILNKNLLSMHTRSICAAETVNNAEEREQEKPSIVSGGTGVGNKVNSSGGGNSSWNLDLIKIDPKNLNLTELADLKTRMENELGDIRRMMSCLEISRKHGKFTNVESENVSKTGGEEAHMLKDNNKYLDASNLQKGDGSPIAAGFEEAGEKVELHVEGKVAKEDVDENHGDIMVGESKRGDEPLKASNDDVDAHVDVSDNGDAEINEYVMV